MKVRVAIADLAIGMFVVAEVRTLVIDGEMRHFLEPLEANYREATSKRLRLMRRKFEQVAAARGLLMTSSKQIGALGQIGLTEVVVDTDKSDILPPNMPTANAGSTGSTGWISGLPRTETRDGATLPPTEEKAPARGTRRVDIAGTERRRNFGPSNAGWMKLEVVETDEDDEPRLCAFLQVISFGGDARMGPAEVLRALDEEYGICEGLEMAMIRKLGNQAAASPNRVIRGQFLVASSPRREPDEAGQIDYPCLQGLSRQLPFAEVQRKLTESTAAADTVDHTLRVCTVVPGEELALFAASGAEGPPDIFGQRRAPAVAETLLRAGDHVDVQDDRFVSRIFGYLCLADGAISVLPPLWISPDRMEAHYIHLSDPRRAAPTPTRDWLLGLLDEAGVTYGRQEEAIDRLLAAPPEDPVPIQLAMGRLPIAGVDAQVVTHFGGDSEDLAEKHQKSLVEAGSLVAQVTPATEGTPGTDISGTEVRAAAGRQQHLVAGPNVRCEEREGSQLFYAEIEGSARVLGQTLRVQPVVYVRGSVDRPFKVKPGTDVYVRGSVRSAARSRRTARSPSRAPSKAAPSCSRRRMSSSARASSATGRASSPRAT